MVVDAIGNKQVFSFDAWGKRRSPFSWEQIAGGPQGIVSTLKVGVFNHLTSNRGYTGHEMLDEVGLIHMNGRVYDPHLARFVSADPTIDGVTSVQGYNRYAYVHNNPLLYTDPSGYSKWTDFRDKYLKPIVAIAVTIYTGGAAAGAWGFFGAAVEGAADLGVAALGGAVSGAIQTGTLQGAFSGAFSAAAFYGVGSAFQGAGWAKAAQGSKGVIGSGLNSAGFASKVLAHAITGGVMSDLQGGKFGHGFACAGVTQAFSGAFSRAFNDEAHQRAIEAAAAKEHYMKYGVYPRVNGVRRQPSVWDQWDRGVRTFRGVDHSSEIHQYSVDNPEFVDGVQTSVNVAAIPFKSVALISKALDAGGVAHDLYLGSWRDASLGVVSIAEGEGATKFLDNFTSNDVFQRVVSTGVQQATQVQLENDCLDCKK